MFREIGFGLLFISIIIKTLALFKANDQSRSLEERKKGYKTFNLPANIIIFVGVLFLLYSKYFA